MKPEAPIDVLAIGHALVDVMASASESFLVDEQLVKGSMQLITDDRARQIYSRMGPANETSGGSAANTATGVVACGGTAEFIGTVAYDQLGEIFTHDIRASGVQYRTPPVAAATTGRSLILVTPDGERTMNTLIGAADQVSISKIARSTLQRSRVVFVEGYLFDSRFSVQDWKYLAEAIHSGGGMLAVSLSDPFCVERHRELFLGLMDGTVDICIGNYDEVSMLFGSKDLSECVQNLTDVCRYGAITMGAKGSIVTAGPRQVSIPAHEVDVVDTTGAGDMYAAGFLAGLAKTAPIEQAGAMASKMAGLVIAQMGARFHEGVSGQLS